MTIVVVTHELASAFLIADRMLLIDKGQHRAIGTTEEMQTSTQPRVRQFLDRVPEPEISGEMDLPSDAHSRTSAKYARRERIVMQAKREQALVGLFVIIRRRIVVCHYIRDEWCLWAIDSHVSLLLSFCGRT